MSPTYVQMVGIHMSDHKYVQIFNGYTYVHTNVQMYIQSSKSSSFVVDFPFMQAPLLTHIIHSLMYSLSSRLTRTLGWLLGWHTETNMRVKMFSPIL